MSAKYQPGDRFYQDFGPLKNRVIEIVEVLPNGTYRMNFVRIPGGVVPAVVLRPYTQETLQQLQPYRAK